MNSTFTKVYAAVISTPLAAIVIASAVSNSDSYDYGDYESDAQAMEASGMRDAGPAGATVSEAKAYSSLGKYNPCIFIECDGE